MRPLIRALGAAFAPSHRSFLRALADPARAQADLQRRIAADLARTEYGRSLGVRGPEDLGRVPIVDYEALAPWIARQQAEEGAVLTADRVLFYEKTSGSTGPAKYIPYTRALRASFSRMFRIWAHDLVARGPRFRTGKLYFSVSPSLADPETTARGVKVGLEDDSEYLDGLTRRVLSPFVVGREAARARDPERFKRLLASALIAEPRLELISVWNPSFLRVVLDWARRNRDALDLPPARRALLEEPIDWTRVWPELKLISAWTAGHAARPAAHLAAAFPGVLLQGKGLLATEAPITVPLLGAPGPVPLVDEVLIELERDGALTPLAGAREGEEYALVLSQRAGLVRYRLGDVVRVGPRHLGTPTLELVGRAGAVADLVGEKLNEAFVREVLAREVPGAAFSTLIPLRDPDRYVLLVDAGDAAVLAARVERGLVAAHHYGHARRLGQLEPVRALVDAEAEERVARYLEGRGIKRGDQKHRALFTAPPEGAFAAWLSG